MVLIKQRAGLCPILGGLSRFGIASLDSRNLRFAVGNQAMVQ